MPSKRGFSWRAAEGCTSDGHDRTKVILRYLQRKMVNFLETVSLKEFLSTWSHYTTDCRLLVCLHRDKSLSVSAINAFKGLG